MNTSLLYELNPRAVMFPAAGHAVLQLLGHGDLAVADDPSAAAAFLACFDAPCPLAAAEARFAVTHSAPAFQRLLADALRLDLVREQSRTSDAAPFDGRCAGTMLSTLTLVAEDLMGDIAAMDQAAPGAVHEESGEPLDRLLRRALADLTRIAVALARRRGAYLDAHFARLSEGKRPWLHLGAGGCALDGWYNIDFPPAELPLNLRWTLPFAAQSIELVFLSHLLEHLYKRRDVPRLLNDILRVLKPGGTVRIIVPDAEVYMRAYVEDDDAFFAMQRQVWFTWAPRARTRLEAILGYLGAPEFPGALAQHKYGYDFATLALLLQDAGFEAIARSSYMASPIPALRVDDSSFVAGAHVDGRYASLFLEARKPAPAGG